MAKTWNEIINDDYFEVQYIELTLNGNKGEEVVNAMLLDGIRIDETSLPDGFIAYSIRHSDNEWDEPASVEKRVIVNFFGTILVDHELFDENEEYLEISDWYYKDWEDVAAEELSGNGISDEYTFMWENLEPISVNVSKIKESLED